MNSAILPAANGDFDVVRPDESKAMPSLPATAPPRIVNIQLKGQGAPSDSYIRDKLIPALNDALPASPPAMIVQREIPPTEEMVEIPAKVMIQCPKARKLIRGVCCESCEFFEALNIRMQGPKLSFEAKYTCVCKYPTQRAFYSAEPD